MALRLLKTCALAAIMLMSAEGKPFHIDLDHNTEVETMESLVETSLLFQNNIAKLHAMQDGGRRKLDIAEAMELINQQDSAYQGKMKVGTPGKTFNMIFDTGSSNVWVPDKKCKSRNAKEKPKYDRKQSTTYVKDGRDFQIQYGSGPVSGEFAEEKVTVGSLAASNMTLGLISDTSGLQELYSNSMMDGIAGMGYEKISLYENPTLIDVLYEQKVLDNKIFAFFLGQDGAKGELTFGGYNEKKFTGDITWHPVTQKAWWVIEMNSIELGDDIKFETKNAIVDSGTSLNTAPPKLVRKLGKALKCIEIPQAGLYVKSCKKALQDPDLHFNLGGTRYTFGPRDYYIKDPGNGICILSFLPMDMGGEDHYILGDVFMRKYYTIHDKDNDQVGFAPANQPDFKESDRAWGCDPKVPLPPSDDEDFNGDDEEEEEDSQSEIPEEAKRLIEACIPGCMDGADVNVECVQKCVEAGGPEGYEPEEEAEEEYELSYDLSYSYGYEEEVEDEEEDFSESEIPEDAQKVIMECIPGCIPEGADEPDLDCVLKCVKEQFPDYEGEDEEGEDEEGEDDEGEDDEADDDDFELNLDDFLKTN